MKRTLSISIFIVSLFFILCSCNSSDSLSDSPSQESPTDTPEATPTFTVEEYKSLVRDFVSAIEQPALNAANVANYIKNYVTTLGKIPSDVTESGLDWFEEKSGLSRDDVESPYIEISSMYKEIVTVDISDPEVSEIDGYVRDLFSSYKTIYDLVFSPSGSASSYASSLNSAVKQYSESIDYLEIFLSEDKDSDKQ